MSNKKIDLGSISIPLDDFAIQGNAILGIKESGKSYAAMYTAEQLLEYKIPFIAFDQIGIWKNIKIPGRGRGYEVVVAGGRSGDLPLTVQSAPEIVRAAMKNNVPLVLDMYDTRISKKDRRHIVELATEILLYENADHGPRMVYIEEAPQVVPQRVTPDVSRVYGMMEEFCRMGGNSYLGYTLIGLRPEEVNKAVLELCDCVMLFRQKGRNSLTSMGKWMSVASVDRQAEIAASIPVLQAGECWVWPRESAAPTKTRIPQKNSFHPDRRKPQQSIAAAKRVVDVSSFVTTLSADLEKHAAEAVANDPKVLKREIERLTKLVAEKKVEVQRVEIPVISDEQVAELKAVASQMIQAGIEFGEAMSKAHEISTAISKALQKGGAQVGERVKGMDVYPTKKPEGWKGGPSDLVARYPDFGKPIPTGAREILTALRQHENGCDLAQLMQLTGYAKSSVNSYVRDHLVKNGLAQDTRDQDEKIHITKDGAVYLGPDFEQLPTGDALRVYWLANLPEGEADFLAGVCKEHHGTGWVLKVDIETSKPYAKSSRNSYLRALRKRKLIDEQGEKVRASDHLFG